MAKGNNASWCIPLTNANWLTTNNWSLVFKININSSSSNIDIILDDPLTNWTGPNNNIQNYMTPTIKPNNIKTPAISISFKFAQIFFYSYNLTPTTQINWKYNVNNEDKQDGKFSAFDNSGVDTNIDYYITISNSYSNNIVTIRCDSSSKLIFTTNINYTYSNKKTPFSIYNYSANYNYTDIISRGNNIYYNYGILLSTSNNLLNKTEFDKYYKEASINQYLTVSYLSLSDIPAFSRLLY